MEGEATRPTQIDQTRPVSFTATRTAANCAAVVTPGLSHSTSFPARIASTANFARSDGLAAITTKSMEGSSSSRWRNTAGTPGNRLRNPASTRPSVDTGS